MDPPSLRRFGYKCWAFLIVRYARESRFVTGTAVERPAVIPRNGM
jgi:hypothetical protein